MSRQPLTQHPHSPLRQQHSIQWLSVSQVKSDRGCASKKCFDTNQKKDIHMPNVLVKTQTLLRLDPNNKVFFDVVSLFTKCFCRFGLTGCQMTFGRRQQWEECKNLVLTTQWTYSPYVSMQSTLPFVALIYLPTSFWYHNGVPRFCTDCQLGHGRCSGERTQEFFHTCILEAVC